MIPADHALRPASSVTVALLDRVRSGVNLSTPDRGLQTIGAPQAWAAGATGAGVTVAVVDTGIDADDPNLAGRVVAGINLVDRGRPPDDDNGHGTEVAGIIAASSDNAGSGNDVADAGVAPEARIMPVKVLDAQGLGTAAGVAAGIDWAAAHGARVINLSLGDVIPGALPAGIDRAMAAATAAGAICVLAAGNDADVTDTFSSPDAVVVAALTQAGTFAPYSSGVGPAPWALSAPGTTGPAVDGDASSVGSADLSDSMSGTSIAAAYVSGALADLLSLGVGPVAALHQLLTTATPLGYRLRFGAGALNLARAVSTDQASAKS